MISDKWQMAEENEENLANVLVFNWQSARKN